MFSESADNSVLTISELAEVVKVALNRSFGAEGAWVKGVVASYSANSSGHHYLDLQEYDAFGSAAPVATISCVIWKLKAPLLLSQLEKTSLGKIRNGLSLVVRVKPNFWAKGGRLSFQIEEIDYGLSQIANLQEKERIRQKLRQLGIWEFNRSLETPLVPLNIGLVTAKGSAAESDFIGELARSNFPFKVFYQPASTAGDAAPGQIVKAILLLQNSGVDIICLVRGGGSMSDLSVFDTEEVVTAVASSSIPVWVGVGHSTDTTLVEEVSNRFLDVPQSVARAVVSLVQEFADQIQVMSQKVHAVASARVELARLQLGDMANQLVYGPLDLVHGHLIRLDRMSSTVKTLAQLSVANETSELVGLTNVLRITANHTLVNGQARLSSVKDAFVSRALAKVGNQSHQIDMLESSARASDPEVMAVRGFSLLASEHGNLIRDISSIEVGDRIKGIVGHGSFIATVDETSKLDDESYEKG